MSSINRTECSVHAYQFQEVKSSEQDDVESCDETLPISNLPDPNFDFLEASSDFKLDEKWWAEMCNEAALEDLHQDNHISYNFDDTPFANPDDQEIRSQTDKTETK